MSAKERGGLKVLHKVSRRHITQVHAARELGVSSRWVRTLLQRMKHEGDRAVMHRLPGRPSNRKLPAMLKQRVLQRFVAQKRAKQWHGYRPTLATEELARDYRLVVSRETLRQWLIASQLWKPHRARAERVHSWRARRPRYGELVQWDTSEHDWLEGRGQKLYLIAMIDDATSRLTARFVRHDSTEENLRQLCSYVQQHGQPVAATPTKPACFRSHRGRFIIVMLLPSN